MRRQVEVRAAGWWVNFEKNSNAAVVCISQSNITLICMLFQLPVSTVNSTNAMEAPNGESGVFTCNVGRTAYFYVVILFSLVIRKSGG